MLIRMTWGYDPDTRELCLRVDDLAGCAETWALGIPEGRGCRARVEEAVDALVREGIMEAADRGPLIARARTFYLKEGLKWEDPS